MKMDFFNFPVFMIFLQSFVTDFGSMPVFAFNKHTHRQLRIYPHYHNLNYELNDNEEQLLKDTVNNVILYVRKVLSVIPVHGPLLLERNACKSSWTSGRNEGKCASIKKDYSGEFCLDDFRIPDEHLEAFYTWTNQPLPERTWYADGNGLKNTDFVLYVQALTTKSCMTNFSPEISENALIAYASYCKLGKNDRPVAGYINFCPTELVKYKTNRSKLILFTLHEIFHALGFSKDLILNYRDSRETSSFSFELPRYSFPILRENNGTYTLLTPALVSKMQHHFECQEGDTNVPEGAPLISRDGILQSHFDSSIFPGSVMSSRLGQPEYTFVDPMTLAVFVDTGWYMVNFSSGDNYLWGKRKGCDFLKDLIDKKTPEYKEKLCSTAYKSGCNYFQTEVINCKSSELFSTSESEEKSMQDCRYNSSGVFHDASADSADFGRCVLYEENLVINGRCVSARCAVGHIWIKLRDTDANWIKCMSGEIVEDIVDGGFVTCPTDVETFCNRRELPIYLQDLVTLEATTVTERPRATYPVTQSNMYSVEQITNGHSVNIGWSFHRCSTRTIPVYLLLFIWLNLCL